MTDARREEARRLRLDPGLSRAELIKHFGVGNGTLTEWLRGIEPPAWTRRPNAKDELRGRAVDLRRDGCSVPEIASRLGVSKSTAYLWTRHLPLDATPAAAAERRRRHMEHMQEVRWEPHRLARDAKRATANEAEAAGVGQLSDREINLIGAVMYWCEGQKAKPWEPNRCRVVFINSDPLLIRLFLRFVDLLGADRSELTYRITIHESADVEAASHWWADVVGVPVESFRRPTLKKHNPSTVRHNVGEPYRGCLVVAVPKSRPLYWRIEGIVRGIGIASGSNGDARM
jgi:transposase